MMSERLSPGVKGISFGVFATYSLYPAFVWYLRACFFSRLSVAWAMIAMMPASPREAEVHWRGVVKDPTPAM